jgi:hypothetical protein
VWHEAWWQEEEPGMQRLRDSSRLSIGLCGLVLISAYCLFDLLDIDGSSFSATKDIPLLSAEEVQGEGARELAPGPLQVLAAPRAPEAAPVRRYGVLRRYRAWARSRIRARTLTSSWSSNTKADPA